VQHCPYSSSLRLHRKHLRFCDRSFRRNRHHHLAAKQLRSETIRFGIQLGKPLIPRRSRAVSGRETQQSCATAMRALHECRLYGIIDLGYVPRARDCSRIAEQMIIGGVDLIQLRGKGKSVDDLVNLAVEIHKITEPSNTPLIVNDHAEIAKRVPVEGVHVGQDDDSIFVARQKAGRNLIVGKSTHSLAQARAAENEGADYIGFGPIFATPTKPDYKPIGLGEIRQVHIDVGVPIFCIGGINIDNVQQVIDHGAKRVVMVSALLKAHSIVDYARCSTDMLA
jgi:thiamine-phosphate pyrophosphorylase